MSAGSNDLRRNHAELAISGADIGDRHPRRQADGSEQEGRIRRTLIAYVPDHDCADHNSGRRQGVHESLAESHNNRTFHRLPDAVRGLLFCFGFLYQPLHGQLIDGRLAMAVAGEQNALAVGREVRPHQNGITRAMFADGQFAPH